MRIVWHYERDTAQPYRGDVCIHLKEPLEQFNREEPGELWLESFDPALMVKSASLIPNTHLNGLLNSKDQWRTYGDDLHRFGKFILIPFDPDDRTKSWEQNVDEILRLAEKHLLHKDAMWIDVCIRPQMKESRLSVYMDRAGYLKRNGLRTAAGLDNYVFRVSEPEPVMQQLLVQFDAVLDYALISTRLSHILT
ncbi:MAG: hypothetical protein K0Q59_2504 [Paenibacillus sp.]|nr:hypothetical protein [Paenibacillus sp.]